MVKENQKQIKNQSAETIHQAMALLRSRLCDPSYIFTLSSTSPDSNFSKLKYIVSSSVTEACNNSVLLLGPRGCGKFAVLELVLDSLLKEFPEMICVIKLNGLLHCDDNCALKEIARQLCLEHQLIYSKMASFDDNSQFMISMLRECGLAHKTVVFVLDEFDLFTQVSQKMGCYSFTFLIGSGLDVNNLLHLIFSGKTTGLLYSLLDAMQSVTSQAVVIGVSCRLDADQLLEKRVRSRFSHRKLLFHPPTREDLSRILEHILVLPADSSLPQDYVVKFNSKVANMLADGQFKGIVDKLFSADPTFNHLLRFLFCATCYMDTGSPFLSLENFKAALSSVQRQPKFEALRDCSILELYILVCMRRLEVKELETCNFHSIMKEYKSIHDSFQRSDYYARPVCLRAFEHLLQRELISLDNRGHGQSIEFRPVKLLVTWNQLHEGLKSYRSCPAILHKLLDMKVEMSK